LDEFNYTERQRYEKLKPTTPNPMVVNKVMSSLCSVKNFNVKEIEEKKLQNMSSITKKLIVEESNDHHKADLKHSRDQSTKILSSYHSSLLHKNSGSNLGIEHSKASRSISPSDKALKEHNRKAQYDKP
jgi:hypothetical protein